MFNKYFLTEYPGLEISQNKICGGEYNTCKFELNKNTLLFSIDVVISGLEYIPNVSKKIIYIETQYKYTH